MTHDEIISLIRNPDWQNLECDNKLWNAITGYLDELEADQLRISFWEILDEINDIRDEIPQIPNGISPRDLFYVGLQDRLHKHYEEFVEDYEDCEDLEE
jgi:hypothetical protein